MTPSAESLFDEIALIGIGLINSSLARALKRDGNLARRVIAYDNNPAHAARARDLAIVDNVADTLDDAVGAADLIILGVPVGAYRSVAGAMAPHLRPGAIVSDVGSVKEAVIRDVAPLLPETVHFVPGHPVAGTEHSGPDAGFAELFDGRWCILTPPPGTDATKTEQLASLWRRIGSMVEIMEPHHHDVVLAVTSHLPHLIAYTIVGTADDLRETTRKEVIKFSAGGFRDFTRIAASDPTMWRDVFLNNREAVLEVLGRFSEDLSALQRAIRWGEGDKLEALFTRTRAIRRGVIEAKQA